MTKDKIMAELQRPIGGTIEGIVTILECFVTCVLGGLLVTTQSNMLGHLIGIFLIFTGALSAGLILGALLILHRAKHIIETTYKVGRHD